MVAPRGEIISIVTFPVLYFDGEMYVKNLVNCSPTDLYLQHGTGVQPG
jgi:hypothetical protein